MRAKLPWILFAASLALNLFFLGGAIVGRVASDGRAPEAEERLAAVAEELSLSQSQLSELRELRQEMRARWRANRESGQGRRAQMLAELAKPTFDREAFLRLSDERFRQRREFFADFGESLHGYLQGLQPEQRQKFLEMAKDRGFLRRLFRGPRDVKRDN